METWQWLAPEVIEGKKYNERSDLYSLGIVVYELLSG
jgi:serine/threonine protein kinase